MLRLCAMLFYIRDMSMCSFWNPLGPGTNLQSISKDNFILIAYALLHTSVIIHNIVLELCIYICELLKFRCMSLIFMSITFSTALAHVEIQTMFVEYIWGTPFNLPILKNIWVLDYSLGRNTCINVQLLFI